jgi:hypothetical protein
MRYIKENKTNYLSDRQHASSVNFARELMESQKFLERGCHLRIVNSGPEITRSDCEIVQLHTINLGGF